MARVKRWGISVGLGAALIILGVWLGLHFLYFNLHVIVPGRVYRSAQPSPRMLEKIVREDHVRSILKFNRAAESTWSREEFAKAKSLGVEMFYVPIGVAELPGRQNMIQIINALDHAPRPLLVHCKTGADRTGLAAVLLAMQNGESFSQARKDQLRLRFGHVGRLGDDVDDVLRQYDQDRAAEGKSVRSYADFRAYVLEEYYPGYYHAGIEALPSRVSGHAGETVVVHVKVTNLSPRPWSASWLFPFRVNVGIPGTGSADFPELLAHKRIGDYLPPGKSKVVEVPVKIPDVAPGVHRYILDVAQVWGLTFGHFGSPTGNVYLDVEKEN